MPSKMNENTDIIEQLSKVDLNLVEKVFSHLTDDNLEERVS